MRISLTAYLKKGIVFSSSRPVLDPDNEASSGDDAMRLMYLEAIVVFSILAVC